MSEILEDLKRVYEEGKNDGMGDERGMPSLDSDESECKSILEEYSRPFTPEMLLTEEFGKWTEIKKYPACTIYGHVNHVLYAHNNCTYDLMAAKEHCIIISNKNYPTAHEMKIILKSVGVL